MRTRIRVHKKINHNNQSTSDRVKSILFDNLLKFEKFWIVIPFIFYAFGFLIHNVYLSEFSTFDYEIIQTKYIYIGFLFSFYISIFYLFLFLGFKNPNQKTFSKLDLFTWMIRLPLVVFFIDNFLESSDDTIKNLFNIIDGNIFILILFIYTAIAFLIYFFWFSMTQSFKNQKIDKVFKIYFSLSLLPIYFTSYLYSKVSYQFTATVNFLTTPFFYLLILIILFQYIFESRFLKQNKIFINIFSSILLFFLIFFVALNYSKNIYPILPTNFGGAQPTSAIIYTESDTIDCLIINENSEWLLLKEAHTIGYERLRINSVKSLKLFK